jgi:ABC-type Fe3+-hydroxamate transport system substrate-binding protein
MLRIVTAPVLRLSAILVLPLILFAILSHSNSRSGVAMPPQNPSRVVSLSPSITSMAEDLGKGSSIIAVTSYDSFKERNRKVIGTLVAPNIELIASLAPDLVLCSQEDSAVQRTEPLVATGIAVRSLPRGITFESIIANYQTTAHFLGADQLGDEKIKRYRSEYHLSALRSMKTIFLLSHDPFIAAAESSFIGNIIKDAGGVCAIKSEKNPWPVISREFILAVNPDCVISIVENPGQILNDEFRSKELSFMKTNAIFHLSPDTAGMYTPSDYLKTKKAIEEIYESLERKRNERMKP